MSTRYNAPQAIDSSILPYLVYNQINRGCFLVISYIIIISQHTAIGEMLQEFKGVTYELRNLWHCRIRNLLTEPRVERFCSLTVISLRQVHCLIPFHFSHRFESSSGVMRKRNWADKHLNMLFFFSLLFIRSPSAVMINENEF